MGHLFTTPHMDSVHTVEFLEVLFQIDRFKPHCRSYCCYKQWCWLVRLITYISTPYNAYHLMMVLIANKQYYRTTSQKPVTM